jgi:hypothetical protein
MKEAVSHQQSAISHQPSALMVFLSSVLADG